MKNAVLFVTAVALVITCCMAAFAAPQAIVKKGEEVYGKQNCKNCHSIAGIPANKKSPLDGVGARLTEELIKKWIRTPKEMNAKVAMPAYGADKISDGDLANMVAYLLTLKK
jgi:mono/diheme cytochrome c family protein